MASYAQIVKRWRGVLANGGIACPLCSHRTGILYTKRKRGFVRRRHVCGTCGLRVTTTERIVGGYSALDVREAQARLAKAS